MPKCCVKSCRSTYSKNPSKTPLLSLHKLPKKEEMRKKWLESLGHENIDFSQENIIFICSLHFEDTCLNRTLHVVRLRENAIPTRLSKVNQNKFNKTRASTDDDEDDEPVQPGTSTLASQDPFTKTIGSTAAGEDNVDFIIPNPEPFQPGTLTMVRTKRSVANQDQFNNTIASTAADEDNIYFIITKPEPFQPGTSTMANQDQLFNNTIASTAAGEGDVDSNITDNIQPITSTMTNPNIKLVQRLRQKCAQQRKKIHRLNTKCRRQEKKLARFSQIIEDLKKTNYMI